ncbi:MAG TPA: FHA domain-containing protein [Mycobacteriales bacterium]|nr:FHA domain-containing protein [Mycobacteriales bacterium]
MSALVLFLLKVGFLAVLWLFVLVAVLTVRRDLLGPRPAGRTAPPVSAPRGKRGDAARPRKAAKSAARHMVVVQGVLEGTRVPLGDGPITIGRADDSTLVLSDDYVSSRHARLFPRDGQWLVEDMGSTNGTFLDRQKVTSATPVPLGVPIRVGKTVMELRR